MARKLTTNAKPLPNGAEDLEILYPERTLTVGGKKLTVREYGFMEGLALQQQAAPILNALVVASAQPTDAGFERIMDVLADHSEELLALVAQAADVEPAFVRGLTDSDGQALLMTWWLVNGGFFVRRVVRRLAIQAAAKAQAAAGATSSASSPPPASAATSPSASTQDVN